MKIIDLKKYYLNLLYKGGYIMSIKFYSDLVSPFVQTKVLLHNEKLRKLQNEKIVMPVTCEIDLTDGFCNNKCKHCFFGTDKKAEPIIMNTKTVKELIKELSENGTKAVEFSGGGEPTTHPDVCEIIEYALSLGLDIGLITNGLLLNKIKDLVKYLKFVRVSLDAANQDTYKKVHGVDYFDTVIENIKCVSELPNRNKIGLGYLIVPDNVCDIFQASLLANDLGVRFIQYRPASLPYEVDKHVWIKAASEVKRAIELNNQLDLQIFDAGVKWLHVNDKRQYLKCYTSSLVAVVKANGDIPLCVLKRNDIDYIIGNIYNSGFVNHWFSNKHLELIQNIDLNLCRKPCKHDSYNIACEALALDLYHENFI